MVKENYQSSNKNTIKEHRKVSCFNWRTVWENIKMKPGQTGGQTSFVTIDQFGRRNQTANESRTAVPENQRGEFVITGQQLQRDWCSVFE